MRSELDQGKSFMQGNDKEGRPVCLVDVRHHKPGDVEVRAGEGLEGAAVWLRKTGGAWLGWREQPQVPGNPQERVCPMDVLSYHNTRDVKETVCAGKTRQHSRAMRNATQCCPACPTTCHLP